MRIVGGRFGGRPLRGPSSSVTRPTTDRLREALFNVLAHAYDDAADGARVLDLFAGTGALGLEALSRGAKFAVFVEEASEPRGLIRANIEALGLGGITRIFRRDATKLGTAFASDAFDLVFCDPPYGHGLAERSLEGARDGGWLAPGALILVEEAVQSGFTPPDGFTELERRRYDTTEVVFLRAPGGATD